MHGLQVIANRLIGHLTKGRLRSAQPGQILIIVAFAIVGLVAFMGLVVDTGLVFVGYGALRRSVDSAALAAAAQYRKDPNPAGLTKAALEFLRLERCAERGRRGARVQRGLPQLSRCRSLHRPCTTQAGSGGCIHDGAAGIPAGDRHQVSGAECDGHVRGSLAGHRAGAGRF